MARKAKLLHDDSVQIVEIDSIITDDIVGESINVEPEVVVDDIPDVVEPEPDVKFIFNNIIADKWLHNGQLRLINMFNSIRFVPHDMSIKNMNFLIGMAVRALTAGGILYIPDYLSNSPSLVNMKRGKTIGEYVEFLKG